MLLTLSTLKKINFIGAAIMFVLSIIIVAVIIWCFVITMDFARDNPLLRTAILTSFLLMDLILISVSIAGIYGIKKNKIGWILFFTIGIIFSFVCFISLGIFVTQITPLIFTGNCTYNPYPWINNTVLSYQIAQQSLCTQQCPCTMNNNQQSLYNSQQFQLLEFYYPQRKSTNNVFQSQQCKSLENLSPNIADLYTTYGQIEKYFQCSMWCQPANAYPVNLIYLFSNVNNGIPKGYCYQMAKDLLSKYSLTIAISCLFTCIILFGLVIVSLCLCIRYKKDRKNDEKKYYEFNSGIINTYEQN